jgi:16S rRNA (cytosine967-C5)-methyltransferase
MKAGARQCAAEILVQVLASKRPFDEAIARHIAIAELEPRDRNFARLMVMTVLRRLGQIDALLAQMLEKPLEGKSTTVMQCLRLGVAQLVWLDTPAHAAVHDTVETVNTMGFERMKGLVNAVLKRVAREGKERIAAQDEATLNLPAWLYASFKETYGESTARAIGLACLGEPPLDITVKADLEQWAKALGGVALPSGSLRLHTAGKVDALEGYHEGAWWVQDVAASLPVALLGDVQGKTVLDLCAAPGGKSAQLGAAGARVVAVDQSKRRLELLSANMQRLALSVDTVEADILRWKPEFTPDAILLDAPCSATGTLRRHPEVAWLRTQGDVSELAGIQKRLLRRVAGWLGAGGKMVYCVCSLQKEEGEEQTEAFLREHPDFKVVTPPQNWKGAAYGVIDALGALRTHPACLPEAGGMDGFYAICYQRIK